MCIWTTSSINYNVCLFSNFGTLKYEVMYPRQGSNQELSVCWLSIGSESQYSI